MDNLFQLLYDGALRHRLVSGLDTDPLERRWSHQAYADVLHHLRRVLRGEHGGISDL